MASDIPRQRAGSRGLRQYLRSSFLAGLALTVPILVTAFVLAFALNFLSGLLDPLVTVIQRVAGLDPAESQIALQVLTAVSLALAILLVGMFAESQYGSGRIEGRVDRALSSIPGLGAIYESLDEMSQLLLSRDSESFQEVKLVEYPEPGSYTIAFLTAETGEPILEATGHNEMVSLFMPMAPNPFMGGFVIHVSADRVYDVDMTVEEGIQAIVSSGIAVGDNEDRQHQPGPASDRDPTGYGVGESGTGYDPGGGDSDGADGYRSDGSGRQGSADTREEPER